MVIPRTRYPLVVPWNASLTRLTLTHNDVDVEDYNNIDHLPAELRTA